VFSSLSGSLKSLIFLAFILIRDLAHALRLSFSARGGRTLMNAESHAARRVNRILIMRKGEHMYPGKKAIGSLVVCLALLAPLCLTAEDKPPAGVNQGERIEVAVTPMTLLPLNLGGIPKFLSDGGGECTAGGPGSTSCTYGSCTVEASTCSNGQFPCCGSGVCGCSGNATY
jgi:hypothetical protein